MVMELKVHNDTKLVEVWLTNAEKNAPHIQAYLKDIYAKYKSPDYTIAVFQSGSEDLFMKTRDLLAYNKRHSAEHEQKKIKRADKKPRQLKACLYYRIDHPRGVHLLELMKMELSDYAARHNYVVVDEILDYGSGTTLTRPGLKEIFLLMKNYSIDIVLTTEETQLAANIDDRIALREWFSANNTIVKCTRDNKKS